MSTRTLGHIGVHRVTGKDVNVGLGSATKSVSVSVDGTDFYLFAVSNVELERIVMKIQMDLEQVRRELR